MKNNKNLILLLVAISLLGLLSGCNNTKPENVPDEYRLALEKAEGYSELMFMSKAGIFKQLTSDSGENFSEKAAQYAIDNVKADWKANALKKAKEYKNEMKMPKEAVYDQLTSYYGEQFTEKEAKYAIANLD